MKDEILLEKEFLKIKKEKILLFGAGALGSIACKTLKTLSIEIIAVIDNNEDKQGKYIEGIEIISLEYAKEKYLDKKVIICIFDNDKEAEARRNLQERGFKNFLSKDLIVYLYLKKNIKSVGFKVENDKINSISALNLIITEYCSLKCKYCSHYIPYRKNPVTWKKEDCIKWAVAASEVFDRIEKLVVCGGELMLHPDLNEIVEKISQISNVQRIDILTNGTIAPSKKLLNILQKSGKCRILVSDYGELNYKVKEIEQMCKLYDIPFSYALSESMWVKNRLGKAHGRSEEENRALYCSCIEPSRCPAIVQGRLYRCVTSYVNARMGFIPETVQDYVDLLNEDLSIKERKDRVREFVLSTEAPLSCDYCSTESMVEIPRAEQLKKEEMNQVKLEDIFL